nr:N-acetyl-1-D-myo-inositol-2-amino-2-deoxy-alpha-D-glucopyranoside deacetylase [Haloechinothrix aidingensis]
MLVHAHPDDETLTTGGTIARYAAEGAEVTLVTCTLGEEGEIIPADLAELGSHAGDQLGGYRAGELRDACRVLGVTRHFYLGGIGRWRDSGMAGAGSQHHPRAFATGAFDEQVAQLRAILHQVRPQVVVSYDANGGYGHPDHIRAHEVTHAAAAGAEPVLRVFHTVVPETPVRRGVQALRELPGVPFTVPEPAELPVVADERAHAAIDVSGQLDARLAALDAHRTQVSVWRDGSGRPERACCALSNGMALPNPHTEYFELASGRAGPVETDLFGGLR